MQRISQINRIDNDIHFFKAGSYKRCDVCLNDLELVALEEFAGL